MISCVQRFAVFGFPVLVLSAGFVLGQNTSATISPVIDVHVHAMDESFPGMGAMCPNESKFLASDPSTKRRRLVGARRNAVRSFIPQPRANTSRTWLRRWSG